MSEGKQIDGNSVVFYNSLKENRQGSLGNKIGKTSLDCSDREKEFHDIRMERNCTQQSSAIVKESLHKV